MWLQLRFKAHAVLLFILQIQLFLNHITSTVYHTGHSATCAISPSDQSGGRFRFTFVFEYGDARFVSSEAHRQGVDIPALFGLVHPIRSEFDAYPPTDLLLPQFLVLSILPKTRGP